MDLRAYYKKVREVEQSLANPFVVVVSLETSDGGKPGVMTEVPRATAAKQVVEGRAQIATEEATEAFYREHRELKLAADQAAAVSRMQFMVVPSKSGAKGSKE
jgi:hypothetical protein